MKLLDSQLLKLTYHAIKTTRRGPSTLQIATDNYSTLKNSSYTIKMRFTQLSILVFGTVTSKASTIRNDEPVDVRTEVTPRPTERLSLPGFLQLRFSHVPEMHVIDMLRDKAEDLMPAGSILSETVFVGWPAGADQNCYQGSQDNNDVSYYQTAIKVTKKSKDPEITFTTEHLPKPTLPGKRFKDPEITFTTEFLPRPTLPGKAFGDPTTTRTSCDGRDPNPRDPCSIQPEWA